MILCTCLCLHVAQISEDLLLRKYSAVLLDEAHERNLNTDILLGLLSRYPTILHYRNIQ